MVVREDGQGGEEGGGHCIVELPQRRRARHILVSPYRLRNLGIDRINCRGGNRADIMVATM
jgi:hypothetical protein